MPEDVVDIGKRLYEQTIRAQVEAGNTGKLLMIDVTTGHWVLGSDRLDMARQLRDQNPDAQNYVLRIGYPAAAKFGAGPRRPPPPAAPVNLVH